MNMFKEVADIKTSDQLHLPVPEAKFETVVVQPSEYQKDMVASLSERAADVHAGIIDPSVDNMLKITSDGRKLGLDQRLMNPLLPDDPNSKLNACVGNVLRIWQEGQADKLTQLLFCDLSTPKNDGTFNVYDDIKTKLMANGVPAEEVAFIHDADISMALKRTLRPWRHIRRSPKDSVVWKSWASTMRKKPMPVKSFLPPARRQKVLTRSRWAATVDSRWSFSMTASEVSLTSF